MIDKEQQAKQRFLTLNLIRFFGVACVFAGTANIGGKFLPDLAPYLGYVLLLNGAADVLLIPAILKKSWQKQDSSAG